MDPQQLVQTISALVEQHDLENRAQTSFRAWVNEVVSEEADDLPEGWSYDQLTASLRSIALWFKPPLLNYPYMDTTLDILRDGESVGYYRFITTLDGEEDDDYFVLDDRA